MRTHRRFPIAGSLHQKLLLPTCLAIMECCSLAFLAFSLNSFATQPAHAQEFTLYDNGLIYSDTTMKKLTFIVDSLNNSFRQCNLQKKFYSKPQAHGYYLYCQSNLPVTDIEDALEKAITPDALRKKFSAEIEKLDAVQVTVKYQYTDYDQEEITEFAGYTFSDKSARHAVEIKNRSELYPQDHVKGSWIYTSNYWDYDHHYTLEAFYFTSDFIQAPLPDSYAMMIAYSECMIDTSTLIYIGGSTDRYSFYNHKILPKREEFYNAILIQGEPVYCDENDKKTPGCYTDFHKYLEKHNEWKADRDRHLESIIATDSHIKEMLTAAANEAIENHSRDIELEEYVGKYISKDKELEMMRNYHVMGQCSMDQSPRIHAMNIALLSAETSNWEVFLRAHLDIMNDRFHRASDGSYAWGHRKTYIQELERLNINVPDLLLGTLFRIANPATNHYFGAIDRTGRALSETKDAAAVEKEILTIIRDTALDDYNRLLFYFMYTHYLYNLKEADHTNQLIADLKSSVNTFPFYLREDILALKKADSRKK